MGQHKKGKKSIGAYFNERETALIKKLADQKDMTMSDVLKLAIENLAIAYGVKDEEKK